ncbi:DUF6053 domain-containing protein [Lysobacter yananisis]
MGGTSVPMLFDRIAAS